MKNALKKTIMIAALLFCSNVAHAKSSNFAKQNKIQVNQIIFSQTSSRVYNHQLTPMLALQTDENLKTYHIGSKFFNPAHKIPTAKDLEGSIRNHPFFIGRFENEPSHQEYMSLKDKISHPFILETNSGDFYMVHSKGVRHFVVNAKNDIQDSFASIDNSAKNYPDIKSFVKCTLGTQSV